MKMEMKENRRSRGADYVLSALFLAAAAAMILETLGARELLLPALAGVLPVLLPRSRKKTVEYGLPAALAFWLVLRAGSVLDGAAGLANRLFARSEAVQAYAYDYFVTRGTGGGETVLFCALALGWLCRRWGNGVLLALCGLWAGAMAYFGVTPGPWILAAVLLCGLLTVLSPKGRLGWGVLAGLLVTLVTMACLNLAPEPIPAVSRLDETLRDGLALRSAAVERIPIPSQVPEPEHLPPDRVEQEQPDHGVQRRLVNVLFWVLAALTLLVLFVPAVIRDRAAKRAEANRADLRAEDPARAIRAMYLYAMRWRALEPTPEPVPEEIYGIWQEAAFSGHKMGEDQRQILRDYMETTAKAVWQRTDRRQRLRIRYRLCL